jgi:hypothetical protein
MACLVIKDLLLHALENLCVLLSLLLRLNDFDLLGDLMVKIFQSNNVLGRCLLWRRMVLLYLHSRGTYGLKSVLKP